MRSSSGIWLALSLALASTACGTTAPTDAGFSDALSIDAAASDAGEAVDSFVSRDAGVDSSSDDASNMPDAADVSLADGGVVERCNRFDDDADGRIDEGSCRACRNCSPCETWSAGSETYVTCQTDPSTGASLLDVWTGLCERVGPGYRAVDLDTTEERLMVNPRVTGTSLMGVGVRAFGLDGGIHDSSGQLRTLASLDLLPNVMPPPDATCLALSRDGLRFRSCAAGVRVDSVTCEGPALTSESQLCVPSAETCNGIDEDCDGVIDDGACDDCETFRFVDHAYLVCPEQLYPGAYALCQERMLDLIAVDSQEEFTAVAAETTGFGTNVFWTGLRFVESDGGVVPRWSDGRLVGSPEAPWGTFAPFPATTSRVGVIQTGSENGGLSSRLDSDPFVKGVLCERPIVRGP